MGSTSSDRTSESQSAIGGNIAVNAGSVSGTYTTDVASANGHLANDFSAAKVSNTLQTEIGAETAAESAAELGVQAADRFGSQGDEGKRDTSASSDGSVAHEANEAARSDAASITPSDSSLDAGGTGAVSGDQSVSGGGDSDHPAGTVPLNAGSSPGDKDTAYTYSYGYGGTIENGQIVSTASVTAHRVHVPGTATDAAAVAGASLGEAGLTVLTMAPGVVGAGASVGLAALQWQHGQTGQAVFTLAAGLPNVVGVDVAAAVTGGKAVLTALRGEQEASAAVHMTQGAEDAAQVGQSIAINKSSGADSAANAANSVRLNDQLAAEEIANGHAFDKHVIDQNEFSGAITTKQQFADQIENILNNPSATKQLSNGRTAYWDNSSGMVVIRNPKAADGGTAFKPTNGKAYFNNLR